MTDIRTVIFDWGGVLIEDPGPGLMQYCAESLGVDVAAYTDAHKRHCEPFCKGLATEEEFWADVCRTLNCQRPEPALWIKAFKASYRPIPAMLELAKTLQQKEIHTALLSNTERPSMEFFLNDLRYSQFDSAVFSCAEGCWKPEAEIYLRALEHAEAKANQSIFIDDREEFVQAAKNLGMQAIQYTGFNALVSFLRKKPIDI